MKEPILYKSKKKKLIQCSSKAIYTKFNFKIIQSICKKNSVMLQSTEINLILNIEIKKIILKVKNQ